MNKENKEKKEEIINDQNNVSNSNVNDSSGECVCSSGNTENIKEDELKKLNDTIIELNNRLKYSQAEMINYRKRKDEETANMLKYANQDLILELIGIADNFERAIKLDDNNLDDSLSKFLAGFKMIYSHLMETLKKFGVEEIETVGKEFDPSCHEALMVVNNIEKPDDTVVECLLKGYTLKGKVIRAAKVIVNKLD